MTEHRIFFAPSGKRGSFAEGTSVLDAARKLGVDLDSVCGGRGICGRCQVEVGEGAFAKLGLESATDHVTGWNAVEARYVSKRGELAPGRRLGCQAKLCGDVVIDIPADSQVHRQVVRKSAAVRDIAIDPVVQLHYIEVREPDMHDPASDLRRLQEALSDITTALTEPLAWRALALEIQQGYRDDIAQLDADIAALQAT